MAYTPGLLEAPRRLLAVEDLEVAYTMQRSRVSALQRLSFETDAGEVFGLVGESGSGKSTLAMAILGQLPASAQIRGGRILFEGYDLHAASPAAWRSVRWKRLAYVPQGAMSALNPVRRIADQFKDLFRDHLEGNDPARTLALLESVHLPPRVLECFPHELSGGMRQRVCIAMAIALKPRLIIADEPTSALDVVSQRRVLETLLAVRRRLQAAILLIGHDLAVQAQVADRIGILLAGRFVEIAPVAAVFEHPRHPYTQRLIASIPSIRRRSGLPQISPATEEERLRWADPCAQLRQIAPGHWVAAYER
jgi:ABC-type glutathione transport system ATPase component